MVWNASTSAFSFRRQCKTISTGTMPSNCRLEIRSSDEKRRNNQNPRYYFNAYRKTIFNFSTHLNKPQLPINIVIKICSITLHTSRSKKQRTQLHILKTCIQKISKPIKITTRYLYQNINLFSKSSLSKY